MVVRPAADYMGRKQLAACLPVMLDTDCRAQDTTAAEEDTDPPVAAKDMEVAVVDIDCPAAVVGSRSCLVLNLEAVLHSQASRKD